MKLKHLLFIVSAAVFAFTSPAAAYVIDISKIDLVPPSQASVGTPPGTTSPFDAEYNPVTKLTDVWLSDMDGGYRGRRVFNWTLDESGGSEVWTFNGAFTTHNTSGIRGISIKDSGSMLVAHVDGVIATYSRTTGAAGYTDLGTRTGTFEIVPTATAVPHHLGFDGSSIWTQTAYNGAFGTSGSIITEYDLTGAQISQFTSISTYTEGIAAAGGFIFLYNAGASVYGHPDDGYVGDILKYSTAGVLLDNFSYESGDRPPFHSEALSWDGTHFWMSGYTDKKVYRLAAEADEGDFGLIPEPATLAIFGLGLAGLGLMRRRKRSA